MVVEKTKASGELVTALFQAFEHGSNSISAVPGLLKQVIREDAWREYTLPNLSVVRKYTTFREFSEKVLRASIEDLMNLCTKDAEAKDLLVKVTKGKQGKRNDLFDNVKEVNTKPPTGNSDAYALCKLNKDRPDLHAKVISGELTANKAMVAAGFRHKTFTIRADTRATAKAIKKHFSQEQRNEIVKILQEE